MLSSHTPLHNPQAFRMSSSEALAADPQHRLLLEETHTALVAGQEATGPLFGTETGAHAGPGVM